MLFNKSNRNFTLEDTISSNNRTGLKGFIFKKIWVLSVVILVVIIMASFSGCSGDSTDSSSSNSIDPSSTESIAAEADSYGTLIDVSGNSLYYTENVTVEEANKLKDYLIKEEFLTSNAEDAKIDIQLDKNNATYEFRMPIKTGLENDDDTIASFKEIATQLSSEVFGGKQCDVHLCDETFKTLRVVVGN